jgi:hypothetical protein
LLPNLQLLAGTANIEKQDKIPSDWVATAFPTGEKRATYLDENDLQGLSLDLEHFTEFFQERRERIRARLINVLGMSTTSDVGQGETTPGEV